MADMVLVPLLEYARAARQGELRTKMAEEKQRLSENSGETLASVH